MPAPLESIPRAELEQKYRRSRGLSILLGALAVVLIAVLGVQWSQGSSENDSAPATAQGETKAADSQAGDSEAGGDEAKQCPVQDRRDPSDTMAIGDVDAPVVIHEWTDLRCPYCGAFTLETLPVLIEEYVETGKVRLEIHDAALVGGENSVFLGVAARAAGEQGGYFEFMHEVYAGAAERGKADVTREQVLAYAQAAGIADMQRFERDLDDPVLDEAVRTSTAEAQGLGVTGVPFFVTSGCGEVLSGAQPVDTFRATLDGALESATV